MYRDVEDYDRWCETQNPEPPLTADTITDEQIHEAYDKGCIGAVTRDLALAPETSGTIRPYYRNIVAEILNAHAHGTR